MTEDHIGRILMEAMKAREDKEEHIDDIIRDTAKNDWRLLQAFMKEGFTREEAISLLIAIHS